MTEVEILKHFRRMPNGVWTTIKPVTIFGLAMVPAVSVRIGGSLGGMDIAAALNQFAVKYPEAVQDIQ
jgi:hypothetical protein